MIVGWEGHQILVAWDSHFPVFPVSSQPSIIEIWDFTHPADIESLVKHPDWQTWRRALIDTSYGGRHSSGFSLVRFPVNRPCDMIGFLGAGLSRPGSAVWQSGNF